MGGLFTSGHAADIILLVLAVEAVWLLVRGWRPLAVLTLLSPAALMILALRLALVGADWPWIALALALSFPLHLADLVMRRAGRR